MRVRTRAPSLPCSTGSHGTPARSRTGPGRTPRSAGRRSAGGGPAPSARSTAPSRTGRARSRALPTRSPTNPVSVSSRNEPSAAFHRDQRLLRGRPPGPIAEAPRRAGRWGRRGQLRLAQGPDPQGRGHPAVRPGCSGSGASAVSTMWCSITTVSRASPRRMLCRSRRLRQQAEGPARQPAEQERQQGFDPSAAELPCDEVVHRAIL